MNERKLKPGTIFFFHYAKWSPVGVILVLTGRDNNRWHFRKLRELKCARSVYVDDAERLDITVVGQLPPDQMNATVFIPSYKIVPPTSKRSRLVQLLKKLW